MLHDLHCDGAAVRVEGDHAVLPGLTFEKDRARVQAFACFEQRGAWVVTQVRGDDRCSEPPPPSKRAR